MDYVICTSNDVYIKLQNGQPITCNKKEAQYFEHAKAQRILKSLPRTLQRFHFSVKALPRPTPEVLNMPSKVLYKPYIVPERVQIWMDRVKGCNGLAHDAAKRQDALTHDLSNIDRELSNCLHEIEMTCNKNAAEGYKEYRKIKDVLERRRLIKDELSVVSSILECNLSSMATNRIQKVVDNLSKRKFTFREIGEYITEVDEDERTTVDEYIST